ncbi:amidase signature enzyme [Meredithblackwellia eburnea MCA 4105]
MEAPGRLEHLQLLALKVGFTIPDCFANEFVTMSNNTQRACELILSLEEDFPDQHFDLKAPLRTDVHLPSGDDNPFNAWAWKGTARGSTGGILSGRTICLKDIVCLAGVPLLFGSDAVQGYVPSNDATVVSRALNAGGTIVGKAACESFSHGPNSFTNSRGTVENPYAKGFSSGGSSSGCGALLAAGLVEMAIAGDQGGSIRVPASLCGLVGLKPTYGLVPYTGILSSEAGVDHAGPITCTVENCSILLQAISGQDGIDGRQAGAPLVAGVPRYHELLLKSRGCGLRGRRIGVLKEGFTNENLDPRVEQAVRFSITKFAELGAEIVEVSIPLHEHSNTLNHILNRLGSSQTRLGRQVGHRGLYLTEFFQKLLPWTQEKHEKAGYYVNGTMLDSEFCWANYPTVYGKAMNMSLKLKQLYQTALENLDCLVMPTVMQPARRHLPRDAGPLAWASASPGIISNTCAFNLTHLPALSIPVGLTPPHPEDIQSEEDNNIRLPVGMQLVGKEYDETTLLVLGDAFEQAVKWKELEYV